MGDYNRSTREVTLANSSSETTDALNKHIELYNLGSILDDALICIEANSEKIKKGLFAGSGPKIVKNTLIITPHWLVQVIKVDDQAAFARSAQLRDLTISDYEKDSPYTKMPDSGVHVTGGFIGASEGSTSFIGLGKDATGEKFKKILIEAVQNAKK